VVKKLKKGLDIQVPFCYDINMMKNGVIEMSYEYQVQVYDFGSHKIVFTAKVSAGANKDDELDYWKKQYPSGDGYFVNIVPTMN
jgi:hypothetical protein